MGLEGGRGGGGGVAGHFRTCVFDGVSFVNDGFFFVHAGCDDGFNLRFIWGVRSCALV